MHKRWIRRSLPVLVFTFIIVLYLDFQFRSLPKHNLVHDPSPDAFPICRLTAMDAQNPACNSSRNRGHPASEDGHVTQTKLKLEDIFVAVKTTGRFHKTRLALLLETWISRTKAHVSVCAIMGCCENSYILDRQMLLSPTCTSTRWSSVTSSVELHQKLYYIWLILRQQSGLLLSPCPYNGHNRKKS